MSLQIFESVLTGSLGALALLCICVWALVQGIVHPDKAYQSQIERVRLLETENSKLNGSIVELTETNTKLQIEIATMREQIGQLRDQVSRLMGDRYGS